MTARSWVRQSSSPREDDDEERKHEPRDAHEPDDAVVAIAQPHHPAEHAQYEIRNGQHPGDDEAPSAALAKEATKDVPRRGEALLEERDAREPTGERERHEAASDRSGEHAG